MQGLNDFYQSTDWQASEQSLSCKLVFEPTHPIFQGHFPGHPVVPGVVSIAIVRELLEKALGYQLDLVQASTVKFLALMGPDHQPDVTIQWKLLDDGIQASAMLVDGTQNVLKMNAVYRKSETAIV